MKKNCKYRKRSKFKKHFYCVKNCIHYRKDTDECPCNMYEQKLGLFKRVNKMPDKLTDSKKIAKWQKEKLGDKNYNKLQAENKDLFYKLEGVMHSVDKWLDGDELKQDEVNRAITMREKTLKIVENLQAENERLNKEVDRLSQCVLYHDGQIVDAKTETYNEIIVFLENRLAHKMLVTQTGYECAIIEIKNRLKELVGGSQ